MLLVINFNFLFVDIPFEFSLCLMLLVSIIVTHSLFVLYSFCYAEEIFEVSHDWRCRMVIINVAHFHCQLLQCFPILVSSEGVVLQDVCCSVFSLGS